MKKGTSEEKINWKEVADKISVQTYAVTDKKERTKRAREELSRAGLTREAALLTDQKLYTAISHLPEQTQKVIANLKKEEKLALRSKKKAERSKRVRGKFGDT